MKVFTRNHSGSTKISDLLLVLFATAYFVSGLCFAKDFFACLIFFLCVACIIIIKYLKLSDKNEE